MKNFKISFLIALLSSSYASQALIMPDLKGIEPRTFGKRLQGYFIEDIDSSGPIQKLIKDNFKGNICITEKSLYKEVDEEFKSLTAYFPRDINLKLFYARFLLGMGNCDEGLNEFSKVIRSSSVTKEHADEFINWLKCVEIDGQSIKDYLENINLVLASPLEYAKCKNLLQGKRSKIETSEFQRQITSSVLNMEANPLFDLLKNLRFTNIYDAMLQIIVSTLDGNNKTATSCQLIGKLYLKNENEASPLLKEYYAFRCLAHEKKYERAISLYESILGTNVNPDNIPQNTLNYNNLAWCYLLTTNIRKETNLNGEVEFQYSKDDLEKLTKAATLLETALSLDNNSPPCVFQNLAVFQMHLKKYDQALININMVLNKSKEELKKYNVNIHLLKKNHKLLLQKLGKTEELQKILLEEQQNIFKKNKKIANLIKLAQIQHATEQEESQKKEQEHQKFLQQSRQNSKNATKPVDNIPTESYEYVGSTTEDGKYKPTEKLSKKKTRTKSTQQTPTAIPQPEQKKSLIHIDSITKNKAAQTTFEKLFDKYKNNVKSDSNVKISFTEIDCFFDALNQKFEKSNGTSHQKVTLNFQEAGSEIGDQMVILTSKTYLKPEQIKDLREAFINARIIPNDPDLIKKLKEEGLL